MSNSVPLRTGIGSALVLCGGIASASNLFPEDAGLGDAAPSPVTPHFQDAAAPSTPSGADAPATGGGPVTLPGGNTPAGSGWVAMSTLVGGTPPAKDAPGPIADPLGGQVKPPVHVGTHPSNAVVSVPAPTAGGAGFLGLLAAAAARRRVVR